MIQSISGEQRQADDAATRAMPLSRSARQSRQVMRLKPKRCSMRKVRTARTAGRARRRWRRTRRAARAGRPCRRQRGATASRSATLSASRPPSSVQPSSTAAPKAICQQAEAALGERVVGGLLVRGQVDAWRETAPAPRRGGARRGASGASRARTRIASDATSAAANDAGPGEEVIAASVGADAARECCENFPMETPDDRKPRWPATTTTWSGSTSR